jgi:hypothetical protein
MYDGRDQRRTGVRVVRVEQIHPLWACKPAHEEGESDPRAWVEELFVGVSECVLKLRASCGSALALRRAGETGFALSRATKGQHH